MRNIAALEGMVDDLEAQVARLVKQRETTRRPIEPSSDRSFEDRVAEFRKGGMSATAALQAARRADPAGFEKYQSGDAGLDFDTLVEREMRKGCMTREIAMQRVATIYGIGPSSRAGITKAADDFNAKVNEIAGRDKVSKTKAMETARKEYPDLFKAYQSTLAS